MTQELNEIRLKKLKFRSVNRGCKEMDIVLTRFAERELPRLGRQDMDLYEKFLEEPDGDIWKWLTGELPPPKEYEMILGLARQR